MFTFQVNDMTCGHCVGAITKSITLVDGGATVKIDLASHQVHIESPASSEDVLRDAILGAGFTPVAVAHVAGQGAKGTPRKGCCCG